MALPSDDDWLKLIWQPSSKPTLSSAYSALAGLNPTPASRALSNALGTIPLGSYPERPLNWNRSYFNKINERVERRANSLIDKMAATSLGRVIPDPSDVQIGSGRHLHLSVMFLDICQFSNWPSSNHSEQAAVLTRLNVFMAEMLNIVRDYGGCFEKNTGDGLMAYFGTTASALSDASKTAVHCAAVMHATNDHVITPWFRGRGLSPIKFRIGIDAGEMTIARVGIPNLAEQRVAIGSHANIACKIMRFAPDGGICIGDNPRVHLSSNWQQKLSQLPSTGFIFTRDQAPYKAWKLNYVPEIPL